MKRPVDRLLRALLVIAAATAVLAACGGGDEPVDDGTATTPTTADPGGDTSTSTTTEPDAETAAVVAVGDDGRVVVLDAATGEERRVLLEDVRVDDPASNSIAVSPDGRTVFVVRPAAPGEDPEIVRVPVDGGDAEVVASGSTVAISPDGTTLAYTTTEGARPPEPLVVLHDLDSGEETQLRRVDEQPFFAIASLAWTADGEQLVMTAGEINTGLSIVDADAEDLDAARRLGPDGREDGTSWRDVAGLPDGRLAVTEWCCDIPDAEWDVIGVDAEDGSVVADPLVPEEGVQATWLETDPDGRLLLVVPPEDAQRPGGATLMRWDGEGDLEEVAEDIVVAAW